jgi:hypothetical protein
VPRLFAFDASACKIGSTGGHLLNSANGSEFVVRAIATPSQLNSFPAPPPTPIEAPDLRAFTQSTLAVYK